MLAVLAFFAHTHAHFDWDLAVARAIQSVPVPGVFPLMRAVSVFGDTWVPFAITPATVLTFYAARRRSEGAGLFLSTAGGWTLDQLAKLIIGRPRPPADLVSVYKTLDSKSFPSGHVTMYVCYFGFLFFLAYALLRPRTLSRRVSLSLCAVPIALVGLSRIYLGEHWPSDVLGGYLLGGLWLTLSVHAYRRWKEKEELIR